MSKLNFVLNVESSYHPAKVNPSLVGAGVGSVIFSPTFTSCGATDVPPFELNVTVYIIFSQIAYTVLFSVISTLVTIDPSVVNDQPLNFFPLGAVNSFAGKVYSPVKSVFGVISPLPPLASNVTVYVVTGIASQIAYTFTSLSIVTLVTISPSLVKDHPLNFLPSGAVNSFAGIVYSPVKSAIGVISPLPPFASNVNVYLFSIHFA